MEALTDAQGRPAGYYASEIILASRLEKLTSDEMLTEVARRFRESGQRQACEWVEAAAALVRPGKTREATT